MSCPEGLITSYQGMHGKDATGCAYTQGLLTGPVVRVVRSEAVHRALE